MSSFAPDLNGQVLAVAASPDGSRVYVGGEFTTADGRRRYRIAAYDTATGALVDHLRARASTASVRAIVATNTTVYVGGAFSTATPPPAPASPPSTPPTARCSTGPPRPTPS